MSEEKTLTPFRRALRTVKPMFWVIVCVIVILDLTSKQWAEEQITVSHIVKTTDREEVEKLFYKHAGGTDVVLAEDGIPFIDGVVHFKWAENFGAAFSIGADQRYLLIAIQLIVLTFVLGFYLKTPAKRWFLLLLLAMITGGAIGNLYDRATHVTVREVHVQEGSPVTELKKTTAVRDFLYFPFDIPVYSTTFNMGKWPIFNVADMSIVGGVIGLMGILLLTPDPKKRREEEDEAEA